MDDHSEKIVTLYQIFNKMENASAKSIEHLITVYQNISLSRTESKNVDWFQIMHANISVWNTSKLPQRFKSQFIETNNNLVKMTEKLEVSSERIKEMFIKIQEEFNQIEKMIKVIPEYGSVKHLFYGKTIKKYKNFSKNSLSRQDTHVEQIFLKFTDNDMRAIADSNPNSKSFKLNAINLNSSSYKVQMRLICTPFHYMTRAVTQTIVSIEWANKIIEENMDIQSLKEFFLLTLEYRSSKCHPYEYSVLLVLIDRLRYDLLELSESLMKIETMLGNFTRMVHTLQLHAAFKKLIPDKISPSDKKDWSFIGEVIEIIPEKVYTISDSVAVQEYKQSVHNGLMEIHLMKELSKVIGSGDEITVPIFTQEVKDDTSFEVLQHLKEFEPESLKNIYLESFVEGLNNFERLVTKKMINGLAMLISPKSSQRSKGAKIPHKSLGFLEGITFILKENFETFQNKISNQSTDEMDLIISNLKSKLQEISDIIKKVEKIVKKVDPILKKLTQSIKNYKAKLPQDMSFLDDKMDELRDQPNKSSINLFIWKSWDEAHLESENSTQELELHWDSSLKDEILLTSSSDDTNSVNFSNLNKLSQGKIINITLDAVYHIFIKVYTELYYLEKDLSTARNILKSTHTKLHNDEKLSLIQPTFVYVILRYFENYVSTSILYFQSIVSNIQFVNSAIELGFECIPQQKSLSSKRIKKSRKLYPRSTIIKVIIPASEDINIWLKSPIILIQEQKTIQESGDNLKKSLITIKLQNEGKSSITDIELLAIDQVISQSVSVSSLQNISSQQSAFLKYNKEDILYPFNTLESNVLSTLQRTLQVIKYPDVSIMEGAKIDHLIGLITLLLSSILEKQIFKEISDRQKEDLQKNCKMLEDRMLKLNEVSLQNSIAKSFEKLQKYIESMERSLKQKFLYEDQDMIASNDNYTKETDEEILPNTMAEHITTKNGGYTWNAVCGTDTGMILKNHKSHEIHTYTRLPVSKRIEIIISVTKYIDQIFMIVENNCRTVNKEITEIVKGVKSKVKNVSKYIKKGTVNEGNLDSVIDSLYFLKSLCKNCKLLTEEIFTILDHGGSIIKDIHTYLNLKFKLDYLTFDSSGKVLRGYRSAVGNRILEMEIEFREFQRYPISLDVPLTFSFLEFN